VGGAPDNGDTRVSPTCVSPLSGTPPTLHFHDHELFVVKVGVQILSQQEGIPLVVHGRSIR
jgi:hypothetical protein